MRAFLLLALSLPLFFSPAIGIARERVLVFAAASTVDALGASVARYRKTAPDDIRISFAATSALARQIEHGAPADLFLAANVAWMDRLESRGLLAKDSRKPLFGNRLVLIAPRDSKLAIQLAPKLDLAARLGPGNRLAVADPDHVPAGIYARAALEKLGMWPAVADRLARTRDVRAALALVARGEAAAGIVYGTDALANRKVRVLDLFPESSHPPITYPLAIVARRDRPAVRALYRFLLSSEAGAMIAAPGPAEIEALLLSLRVAFWAMLWSLPPGIAVAWLLARREFPGKAALDALVHLPLVVPPVVVGYVLLVTLGRTGAVGGWLYDTFGLTLGFSWRGAAVAAAVMAFPLVVRAIRLSLEAVDRRLEDAARTLGAGPVAVFVTVTLPLTAPGLLAGAILGFARSLGEFGATITFVSNIPGETRTLPIALYTFTQTPDGETAALRLVAISVAVAFAALAASEFIARRVRQRIGAAS